MQSNESIIEHSWCRTLTYVALGILFVMSMIGSSHTQHIILVAALMSAIWVVWYGYDYGTDDQILVAGRFNLMTWILWSVGLFAMAMFYGQLKSDDMHPAQRIWLTGVLWCVSLCAIEWIGYNMCGIRLKSNYSGLLGMDLMHGPWYLKVYYLTSWALFLTFLNAW